MAKIEKTSEYIRIITDACYLLNLEAEGQLPRQEYEQWRERWLKDAQAILQDTLTETPEQFTDGFSETTGVHPLPEAVQAWQRAKPAVEAYQQAHPFVPDSDEKPAVPTVRYLEIRLYHREWHHLAALKSAMPTLHEEYEAPTCEETGGPVKVLSVRYDTLDAGDIKLINELLLETSFKDVLVPMKDDSDE